MPYEEVQCRIVLIPNYENTGSCIFVWAHHSMCDAVSIAAIFEVFSEDFDPTNYPD